MNSLAPTSSDVPAPTPPAIEQLTGAQKAAIILSLLEPDQARSIAERFDSGRIDRAIAAFEALPIVTRDELLSVIRSYLEALRGDVPLVAGGQLRADELASALAPPMDTSSDPIPLFEPEETGSIDDGANAEEIWAYVQALDPEKLAQLLADERPAIISAVLERISRDGASAVLVSIDSEKASAVVRHMLHGRKPSTTTYDAIAESLRRVAPERLAEQQKEGFDARELAGIFNRMSAGNQSTILDPIRPEMPDEVKEVEQHLLSFPNLDTRLPKTVVPTVFREMDNALLDKALGHALVQQPPIAEFLLSSISQRLAEQIRERIEEQPPVSHKEGEEAQAELMRLLIEWSEEGRFAFKFPDAELQEAN